MSLNLCFQDHQARGHPSRSLKEMSESLASTLENETLIVGKLLNEVYRCERKQQDLILKIIDALSIIKRDLEEDLMTGSVFFSELPQVIIRFYSYLQIYLAEQLKFCQWFFGRQEFCGLVCI